MDNDPRYVDRSRPVKPITERARKVDFYGESPSESWVGEIEVMSGKDGTMSLHIERSHKAKYGGKKWHRTSTYATITAEAWAHLISAPADVPEPRQMTATDEARFAAHGPEGDTP